MNWHKELWALVQSLKEITFSFGAAKVNLYALLQGMMAIVLLLWVTRLVISRIERRLMRMRDMRPSTRALIVKFIQIALYIFVFLTALQIMGISLAAFSVIGGALGVGIGFGLQKISSNFISGIILLFEKSIEVEDLIELQNVTVGVVRGISARYTRIETADARDILIPNEDFITQRVISLTHMNKRSRIELKVTVHYETDVALALRLLLAATEQVARCVRTPEPMTHVLQFTDHGIVLALYFLIDDVVEGCMEPRTQAHLAVLAAFNAHGVRIATPMREVPPQK